MSGERHPYRWTMLAGLWLVYFSFGAQVAAIPALVDPISDDLGLSRGTMGSVLGAWALVYIVMAVPAGAVIDRIGLRTSLLLGALVMALSGVLRAGATGYGTLFVAVAVFGIGGPIVSVGAPKLIAVWFDEDERPWAMGLSTTGPMLGTVVALATANSVVMPLVGDDWRWALAVFAGVALFSAVVWWLIGLRAPEGAVEAAEGVGHTSLRVFVALARSGPMQLVLVLALGVFLFNHATNGWLPEILREGGRSASAAGYLAALSTAVGLLASLAIPRMAVAGRRTVVLAWLLAALSAAALLLVVTSGAAVVVPLVLLAAKAASVPVALLVLMEVPNVDGRNMGAAGGLFFTAGEVGGVLGPLLLGVAADATGSFDAGLYALSGLAAALVVLSLVIRAVIASSPDAGAADLRAAA